VGASGPDAGGLTEHHVDSGRCAGVRNASDGVDGERAYYSSDLAGRNATAVIRRTCATTAAVIS
jgi:hypothetical protein